MERRVSFFQMSRCPPQTFWSKVGVVERERRERAQSSIMSEGQEADEAPLYTIFCPEQRATSCQLCLKGAPVQY